MACCVELSVTNLVILGIIVFAVKKAIKAVQKWKLEQMLEKWNNTPKDKVILHSIWRGKVIPAVSPYGLKLETYLRLAKIPYDLDTKNAIGPKGKLPWITYNGTHIGDSHLVIQFLNKKLSVDLNKNTTKEQLAIAKSCRQMLENHFVWGSSQYRFIENPTLLTTLMKMPPVMKFFFPIFAVNKKKRAMDACGMGLHTRTEIFQMTEDDLHTLSKILGKKSFFGGEQPCEEDCAIFGVMAQVVWATPGSSFERLVEGELGNLKEFCERMRDLAWPDWEQCLDK